MKQQKATLVALIVICLIVIVTALVTRKDLYEVRIRIGQTEAIVSTTYGLEGQETRWGSNLPPPLICQTSSAHPHLARSGEFLHQSGWQKQRNAKVCGLRILKKTKLEMNENQLTPCQEFQPYLVENYVRHLLAEIADVLEQLYYRKHALDSNWSEGVRAYDRVGNHLIQNGNAILGLEMVSRGLDYAVALDKVPL